jgi:outer membrane protein
MKTLVLFSLTSLCALAEVKTMTLRQAIELALQQNPDVVLARLDQTRARADVTIAKDAFIPKVYAGSGAAYTNGFPTSIDGNAPSIVQAKTQMAIFNRPQTYRVAETNEAVRGAEIDIGARQDEAVYHVVSAFLDAEQAARSLAAADRQVESLERVQGLVDARVAEGRDLPIESKKANVKILQARQRTQVLTADLINAETTLALTLGLDPGDRVHAAQEERTLPALPDSEDRSIEQALDNNRDIKRLESNLQAKNLEIKGHNAERLPKVNLVAQYSMLGRYNNYDKFFPRFQRNNVELGASFDIPILIGRTASASSIQAEAEADKIKIEIERTRARLTADLHRAYQDIQRAESARDLARADLDLARDQLTLDLAQYDEGRLLMAQVEASRATEQEKWLAYYDSQHAVDVARLNVLRQSGTLVAALK